MRRYDSRFSDGVYYLETDDGWIEVGEADTLLALLGETYTLEYGERERAAAWLETDTDGELTFDVRETLAGMTYRQSFVDQIEDCDLSETTEEGVPLRTAVFADMMESIWESKGNLQS
ncbi:hypothetical protein GS429_00050 [Natronorubrum sp. JWXQ-INN-674]|uniref:Uncharacterized protein n=1 Tax=Natronorubrum halalkaliphilum TaxID=2691917 RepID=A0A6B0VHR6_9EURY|nr:hypothetical protein [Natronorubrum halalkaliphilum]MXV60486.1 hypothetical protein [Natronorubrum halalkaliphilum]